MDKYSFIPESAPFEPEQRAWLNGFLAGWAGFIESEAAGAAPGGATVAQPPEEDEEFPWHDPGLEMDERLELAKEKPLKRQLMAAMAQLDCGACGYLCQTYSEAIAGGDEKNLTLCSPGGKETAKMLKKLIKEGGGVGSGDGAPKATANGAATASGVSRANPFAAKIKSCENLNREGSAKHTTHAVIDLAGSGLEYVVGDSLGVYPTNCPDLVTDVLTELNAEDDPTLREELTGRYCLRTVSDELLELIAGVAADAAEADAVKRLVDSDELDEMDVLDVLRRAPSAVVEKSALFDCLAEISPRLYSIASSLKAHPEEVHLTIARATAVVGGREYKGVASTMFSDRVGGGDRVRVYVHKSHGFTVPADPRAPMIMVGPGTGIAPFRAFLEERAETAAAGKNWLFFGDQHQATDFLYEDELEAWRDGGLLTRLSTAFSRDQEAKVYVQDRMREEGAELMRWIDEGGYFFVCGDAKRMAADVDRALHDVLVEHGGKTMAEAMAFVRQLKEEQRYVRDVY